MFGYAYDASGNLLSDGVNLPTWDAENRISSVGGATYLYDAEGNRYEKQGVGVTDTLYFGGRPMARLAAGQWTDLIYGPTGLLAEVPGTQTGQPVYRVTDHLGTTVGSLLADGTFVNPVDYTPFGQVFSGVTDDPFKFTGYERDSESGLDYAWARHYGSNMGRFISPDDGSDQHLQNPQSLNLYSYVRNNPLVYTDPSGRSVNVCDNTGQCNIVSNEDYTAAQQSDPYNSAPSLDAVGSSGNGAGQFSPVSIFGDSGIVGSATYVSDGGADYYANANGYDQLSNTSQVVKAATAVYAGVYGAVGAAIVGGPAVAAVARMGLQRLVMGATSPALVAIINKIYQAQDEIPGGTAGAVRNELMTGEYINLGHIQKASEMITRLENLIQSGTLSGSDQMIAGHIISDLKNSLGR